MTVCADSQPGFQITTADLPKAIVLENQRSGQRFTDILDSGHENRLQFGPGFSTDK
jgi:hypothetical protein